MKKILIPINQALENIPADDAVFAESMARALLDTKGETGLGTVINLWDEVGESGSMAAERIKIVNRFGNLRNQLGNLNMDLREQDLVLTAFCQEFERRVGQKRKPRSGGSIETVTSFILDYYDIRASTQPEHFTTGLEIDRWIRDSDGWYIGISCKRTLRERWKQAYTTDLDLLNRHKIKALWHVVALDHDLSDEKLTEMGSYRAVIYLRDDSPRLSSAKEHTGMKDYVRPMSKFIHDLKHELSKNASQ